jgi:hypothetical protein
LAWMYQWCGCPQNCMLEVVTTTTMKPFSLKQVRID